MSRFRRLVLVGCNHGHQSDWWDGLLGLLPCAPLVRTMVPCHCDVVWGFSTLVVIVTQLGILNPCMSFVRFSVVGVLGFAGKLSSCQDDRFNFKHPQEVCASFANGDQSLGASQALHVAQCTLSHDQGAVHLNGH